MKSGGIAALVQAACYVFGFALLATVLNPSDSGDWTQQQKLEFVLTQKSLYQFWYIVIYVVFGIALVVLTSALHTALVRSHSTLMSIASPFGFIWAGLVIASGMVATIGLDAIEKAALADVGSAITLWQTINVVQDGLGGGVEIVGGIWVLLLSIATWRERQRFSVVLTAIGFVVGIAGIATIVPALGSLGAVFGLVQIFWFIGIGVVLLRFRAVEDET